MPELRRDPFSGRWVAINPDRSFPPVTLAPDAREQVVWGPGTGSPCPFCPGEEARTPPAILVDHGPASPPLPSRDGDAPTEPHIAPPWQLRVFPNRFPALMIEGALERRASGLYDAMHGVGAHEIVVETPFHGEPLHHMPPSAIARVLRAWQARIVDLRNDARFRSVLPWKAHGLLAGARVPHSHSQLVALPLVPDTIERELRAGRAHFEQKERCLFCDVIQQELRDRERVVHEGGAFVAFAPFAARSPFETWLLPRDHRPSFQQASPEELDRLAEALSVVLAKVQRATGDAAYTLALHTAPLAEPDLPYFHYHLELVPCFAPVDGLARAVGLAENPTPPEEAARFLRELSL